MQHNIRIIWTENKVVNKENIVGNVGLLDSERYSLRNSTKVLPDASYFFS